MTENCRPIIDYVSFSRRLIAEVLLKHGLRLVKHDKSAMGEWGVWFENQEFIVGLWQDRGGFIGILLGSKAKRGPRKRKRGPWSMGHLRGYLEGSNTHYSFPNLREEVRWFLDQEYKLFDSGLLNSDELNIWATKASI